MFEIIQKYFIEPVLYESGYNLINTFTYIIILLPIFIGIFKLFKNLKIKIDGKFALSLSPYILLGSVLRVLKDSGFLTSFIFVSPFIYILIFCIYLSSLILSLLIEKKSKIDHNISLFTIGFILSGIFFTRLDLINFVGFARIFTLDLIYFIFIIYLKKFSLWNKFTIFSQCFDASATFISVQLYNYGEQHVIPSLLFSIFGNYIFLIIKPALAILLVYIIDKEIKDMEFSNFLKLVIIILGFAQGTRDLLRLVALT